MTENAGWLAELTFPRRSAVLPLASGRGGRGTRVWNEHPNHAVLPGREEKFAVASLADMRIRRLRTAPRRGRTSIPDMSGRLSHARSTHLQGVGTIGRVHRLATDRSPR